MIRTAILVDGGFYRKLEDITESDFLFHSPQKGVDMRIGIDIASLAYKKQVDQIILIAGQHKSPGRTNPPGLLFS